MRLLNTPPLPPAELQHGSENTLPPLHVITVISNPVRSNARAQLYYEFAHRAEYAGAILHTVELAFGNRPFNVTRADNPHHYQFRTDQELWHKENLINLGISRLPDDWKYVAWVDADVAFTNPNWVNETVQQLQHYRIVQMFNWASDLGPDYAPLPFSQHRGFVYGWSLNPSIPAVAGPGGGSGYPYGTPGKGGSLYHPGYAWAARRETIDALGGLIDWAVLGAADYHMAQCLIGHYERALYAGIHENYRGMVKGWQDRADVHVNRNIGYVDTSVVHYWHGKKADRRYWTRNKVLVDANFDPTVDIIRDHRGVLALSGNKIGLRDGIRSYFRQRNEDSIDN